jgi:hypothetical protein
MSEGRATGSGTRSLGADADAVGFLGTLQFLGATLPSPGLRREVDDQLRRAGRSTAVEEWMGRRALSRRTTDAAATRWRAYIGRPQLRDVECPRHRDSFFTLPVATPLLFCIPPKFVVPPHLFSPELLMTGRGSRRASHWTRDDSRTRG